MIENLINKVLSIPIEIGRAQVRFDKILESTQSFQVLWVQPWLF